jgi:hypothetical protein
MSAAGDVKPTEEIQLVPMINPTLTRIPGCWSCPVRGQMAMDSMDAATPGIVPGDLTVSSTGVGPSSGSPIADDDSLNCHDCPFVNLFV